MIGSDAARLATPSPALWYAKQPIAGHRSRHAVTAGRATEKGQFLVYAWHTHHAITASMESSNPLQQTAVVGFTCAHGPLAPGMEAAGRYLQAPTHQLNRVETATALDRLILQLGSLAKNAAASRKKSLSFFTRVSSRLSVAIS